MTADFIVAYNVVDLTEVVLYDNTDYGSTPVLNVGAVRILFGAIPQQEDVAENVTTLYAFWQYTVVSGSVEINGITYTTGDTIYLANETTVDPDEVSVSTTGFIGSIVTWVPGDDEGLAFTPGQVIMDSEASVFPDYVFQVEYELYGVAVAAATALVSGTTYYVSGTAGDYITISGKDYYVGEVFTASATTAFTNGSGTNYVHAALSSKTGYFCTVYDANTLWYEYMNRIATSYTVEQGFLADFMAVTARLNQVDMYAQQQTGVAPTYIQALLENISNDYSL